MFNMFRTSVLIAALTALFMVVGYFIGGTGGMMIALLFAAGTNLFSYWNSDKMVLRMQNAVPVERSQVPELYDMVDTLSRRAGIPTPAVYVIQSDQPNAFATGRNPQNAAVAVSTGLLRTLETREVAGVVAHELAHIRNRDTLTMTITATFAGAISALAQFGLFFGGGNNRDNPLGGIGALLMVFLAPLAAMVVQMAVSRTREYEADKHGAEISADPLALASALQKIAGAAHRTVNVAAERNPAMAHMYIINPLSATGRGDRGSLRITGAARPKSCSGFRCGAPTRPERARALPAPSVQARRKQAPGRGPSSQIFHRKNLVRAPGKSERHPHPDEQNDDRKREAKEVRLHPSGQRCAVLGTDDATDEEERRKDDVDRPCGQRVDHRRARADDQDDCERRADHDPGRHAQDIDHRRDEDEAAADAEKHSQDARAEAERERRQRRDVETRLVETPAERKGGHPAIVPRPLARRGGLHITKRNQRILEHQHADVTKQNDVHEADDDIDLATRLQGTEYRGADERADDAAGNYHRAHLQISAAAPHVSHCSGHARARDLRRRRCDCHGRRNPVEDQQWRREEAAADSKHAREDADDPAKRDDQQRIDRLAGDREVDVHRQ